MRKLIHVITNDVSRHDVASLILSLGHSVIMAESPEESKEVTLQSDALLVNLGMPSDEKWDAIKSSLEAAKEKKISILLDPVGVGFTEYRSKVTKNLLNTFKPTILRCNASEALCLAGSKEKSLGVDSKETSLEKLEQALFQLAPLSSFTLVTGKTDLLFTKDKLEKVSGGSPLLSKVTGMGDVLNAYLLSRVLHEGLSKAVLLDALKAFKRISEEVEKETCNPFLFRRLFLERLWEDYHA